MTTGFPDKPIGPPSRNVRDGSSRVSYAWESDEQRAQWPDLVQAELDSQWWYRMRLRLRRLGIVQ